MRNTPMIPLASYTVYDYGDRDDKLKHAIHADAMHTVIWELINDLRGMIKHNEDEVAAGHYEEVRTKLFEHLREEDIDGLF